MSIHTILAYAWLEFSSSHKPWNCYQLYFVWPLLVCNFQETQIVSELNPSDEYEENSEVEVSEDEGEIGEMEESQNIGAVEDENEQSETGEGGDKQEPEPTPNDEQQIVPESQFEMEEIEEPTPTPTPVKDPAPISDMDVIEIEETPEKNDLQNVASGFVSQREAVESKISEISAKLNNAKKMLSSKWLVGNKHIFQCSYVQKKDGG